MAYLSSKSDPGIRLLTGTARLASLSLVVPTPLTSPSVERDRVKLIPSASAPAATPSHAAALSPTRDSSAVATPKPPLLGTSALHSSPPSGVASNLSRARPSSLSPSAVDSTEDEGITAPVLDAKRFSPSTSSSGDDGLTPTQSTMGSLKPQQASPKDASSDNADSPEASPPQVRALGDETGGVPSDEEEDRLVEDEIRREREDKRLQNKKRKKNIASTVKPNATILADERTSLLQGGKRSSGLERAVGKQRLTRWRDRTVLALDSMKDHFGKDRLAESAKNGVQSLPAVVLG